MNVTERVKKPAKAWVSIVALVLLGCAMRVHDLTGTPPGIDGDEAFYYMDASQVLLGHLQIYYPTNYGHEPLFVYAEALMVWLLGRHAFTLRYTAVIGGMFEMAIGYALARRLFNRRVALATLALLAALAWPVFMTRLGLRMLTFTPFSMFSAYALWRALQQRSWRWAVAAGVLNGLTLYTYISSRVWPIVILLWLLALLILDRRWLAGNRLRLGLILGLAALIVLPLAVYAFRHPEVVNQRIDTMGSPYKQIQRGEFSGLISNVGRVLGMFTVYGDPEIRYDVGGRPVFDLVTGALFYLGVFVALFRWRRPAYALLFIWLPVTLLPTLLSPSAPSFLRAGGAIFPVLVLAGIGLDELFNFLRRRRPGLGWSSAFAPSVLIGALALGLFTTSVMFGPWRTSPKVMEVYESGLYLAARYLDQNPPPPNATVFVIAGYAADDAQIIFGLQSHNPQRVRWSTDLAWPSEPGEMWYLFSRELVPDDQTRAWLGVPPIHREFDNAGHVVLEVYRLPGPPAPPQPVIPIQARFDQLADLIGVSYPRPLVRGQTGEMDLFWRVRRDLAFDRNRPLSVRVHLESQGLVWTGAGAALLSFPPTQWRTGDIWIQRLKLIVPPDMPPQSIQPELVIHVEGREWPVIPGGEEKARTRFLLPAVEVSGQPTTLDLPPASAHRFDDALALLAVDASPAASQPGLQVFVRTTWQALRDLDRDYALQIQLARPDGGEAAFAERAIWQDVYPTHRWRQGEQVTSNDSLPAPVDIPEGDYRVRIRIVDPDDQPLGTGEWLDVGSVRIAGRPHVFTQPPVDAPLEAEFGSVSRLVGYRLDLDDARPGGSIRLTLVWQAVQASDKPLKVFTHLYGLSDTIQVYAQHDGEPDGGNAPTITWLPGEYIEDEHVIPIDPSVPPGDYRLGVGMYDPELLQRLSVPSGGGASDVLILTPVKLR